MLIPDLLNILFDQSDYRCLVATISLNKRITKYANKYSVLSYYGATNMNLEYAVRFGLIKIVKENVQFIAVNHALRHSVENGDILMVKYLASVGANIHANNDNALQQSAIFGHLEVVKYLVSIGANIHAGNDNALQWSATEGHLEVVKYLVSIGANIHADDGDGDALLWSAIKGHLEVVKYLVSVGANIHANDYIALRRSVQFGHLDVARYLLSIEANEHANNDEIQSYSSYKLL